MIHNFRTRNIMARRLADSRQGQILTILRESGVMRNRELATLLDVSTVTIRSDIKALTQKGLVRRTYGGVAATSDADDSSFGNRASQARVAKRNIGANAVKLIGEGETILLDAGTTAMQIARQLPNDLSFTLVTTSLNVAMEASQKPKVEVVLCGGIVNPKTVSVSGHHVEAVLSEVHADRLFLGAYAVDLEKGLLERNFQGAQTKRLLLRSARHVVLVCDSSKFSAKSPVVTAPLSVLDSVITDDGLDGEIRRGLKEMSIRVKCVSR